MPVQTTQAGPLAGRGNALIGVLAAVGVFLVYVSFQAVVVHQSFEGNYAGAFLFSEVFGLPEAEREAGLAPVVGNGEPGWDGQFYYHLSNDPLLRTDTARHLDSPVYRGQRIGFPALAFVASRVLGYTVTPPRLYLTLQWAVIAAGFGALVWWLGEQRVNRLYAAAWGLSFGVLFATAHGLPDGAADAWFILSLIALHRRRLGLYAAFAALMLLTREGYAAFAAGVWAATALRLARFADAGYGRRVLLSSLPLLAMLAWTGYVSHATGLPPSHGRIPGLVGQPLAAVFQFTTENFAADNHTEILWRLTAAFTLVVVTIRAARFARANPAVGCALPYLVLTTALGPIVWQTFVGYPKAMTGVLVIGLFLLPTDRSLLLRFALAASFVCGLEMLYFTQVQHPMLYSAKKLDARVRPPAGYDGPPAALLADVRSTAVWTEPTPVVESRPTVWKFAHREVVPFRVAVTNNSATTWAPVPQNGPLCIHLGCKIYHPDGHLMHVDTVPLDRPIPPGETAHATVCIPLRRGRYVVVVSGVQHAHCWFHEVDPKFGARYEIEVR